MSDVYLSLFTSCSFSKLSLRNNTSSRCFVLGKLTC